jgi:DNA-binding NtrC family response regulator
MKNILLVFEHSIEFDFIRVVLTTLGFNAFSLHKSSEVRSKIKQNAPELIMTSTLAGKGEILNELLQRRETTGLPKVVWVGSPQQHRKLTSSQLPLIDAVLFTPIQPEKLITIVCELTNIPVKEILQKYQDIQAKGAEKKKDVFVVSDQERSDRYTEFVKGVETKDRVLSMKDLLKAQPDLQDRANSQELLDKKKDFVKALFGKK